MTIFERAKSKLKLERNNRASTIFRVAIAKITTTKNIESLGVFLRSKHGYFWTSNITTVDWLKINQCCAPNNWLQLLDSLEPFWDLENVGSHLHWDQKWPTKSVRGEWSQTCDHTIIQQLKGMNVGARSHREWSLLNVKRTITYNCAFQHTADVMSEVCSPLHAFSRCSLWFICCVDLTHR